VKIALLFQLSNPTAQGSFLTAPSSGRVALSQLHTTFCLALKTSFAALSSRSGSQTRTAWHLLQRLLQRQRHSLLSQLEVLRRQKMKTMATVTALVATSQWKSVAAAAEA
jgi:hypothetical protein